MDSWLMVACKPAARSTTGRQPYSSSARLDPFTSLFIKAGRPFT